MRRNFPEFSKTGPQATLSGIDCGCKPPPPPPESIGSVLAGGNFSR